MSPGQLASSLSTEGSGGSTYNQVSNAFDKIIYGLAFSTCLAPALKTVTEGRQQQKSFSFVIVSLKSPVIPFFPAPYDIPKILNGISSDPIIRHKRPWKTSSFPMKL